MVLKNGTEPADERLGRLPLFDERSRAFPVRAVIAQPEPRSYTWNMPDGVYAPDQGNVGACVAYMLGTQAMMRPAPTVPELRARMNRQWHLARYCEIQMRDPWEGADAVCGLSGPVYSGTAILTGLKVFREWGFFREYRWGFGIADAVLGIGRNGPGLAGTWWRSGMSRPDSSGLVRYSGAYEGGHAYTWARVDVSGVKDWLDGHIWFLNTWGMSWGLNGWARMPIRDAAEALEEQGEIAFVQRRTFRPAGLAA